MAGVLSQNGVTCSMGVGMTAAENCEDMESWTMENCWGVQMVLVESVAGQSWHGRGLGSEHLLGGAMQIPDQHADDYVEAAAADVTGMLELEDADEYETEGMLLLEMLDEDSAGEVPDRLDPAYVEQSGAEVEALRYLEVLEAESIDSTLVEEDSIVSTLIDEDGEAWEAWSRQAVRDFYDRWEIDSDGHMRSRSRSPRGIRSPVYELDDVTDAVTDSDGVLRGVGVEEAVVQALGSSMRRQILLGGENGQEAVLAEVVVPWYGDALQ